jgi:hypothetical protein
MAAVTGAMIALGGLGVSAAQAIKQNKAMKEADSVSQKASKYIKGITEQNAFKQTQVATLGTQLAQQSQAQREAQTMNMLQGAGAEGVIGGVGQLTTANNQSDLQRAAELDQMQYERDTMQAQAQQGINARKQEREFEVGMSEKQDAEMRRAQAEANRNAAIEGAVGFAGSALTSASKLVPLYKENSDLRKKSKDLLAAGDKTGADELLSKINQNKINFQDQESLMYALKNNPNILEQILSSLKK